ncbi:MAG: SPOR domain-containing protein [Flavobacteriales bacterium]|nr:SPOR domain-containing protein [Flavobacteriales bacterium]
MMYSHTITAYDTNGTLLKTISDSMSFVKGMDNIYGAPVEADYTRDGKFIWVSNYQMYGDEYMNPGGDGCSMSKTYDESFIYKIDVKTLKKVGYAKVGSVPKYIAVSPNNELVLVSNWCSGSVTIIDNESHFERCEITVGRFPRGIAINKTSDTAYVAVMGSDYISVLDLKKMLVLDSIFVGRGPRHLCLDNKSNLLYCTINNEGKICKINLASKDVEKKYVGRLPRSMVLDTVQQILHIVCYGENKLVALDQNLQLIQEHNTNHHPIGVTYDHKNNRVWVACYSGSIQLFDWKIKIGGEPQEKIVGESYPVSAVLKRFNIVIGSFGVQENAERLVQNSHALGYESRYFKRSNNMYTVVCANFDDLEIAIQALYKVQEDYPSAWLLKQ